MSRGKGLIALSFLISTTALAEPTKVLSGTVTGFDRTSIQLKTQQGRIRILKNRLSPYLAESLMKSVDHLVLVEVPTSSLVPRPVPAAHRTRAKKR